MVYKGKFELDEDQLFVLKQILDSGDAEDIAREELEEGYWNKKQFSAFNHLRQMVGLGNIDPFDEGGHRD
jgi:hypothetical protein